MSSTFLRTVNLTTKPSLMGLSRCRVENMFLTISSPHPFCSIEPTVSVASLFLETAAFISPIRSCFHPMVIPSLQWQSLHYPRPRAPLLVQACNPHCYLLSVIQDAVKPLRVRAELFLKDWAESLPKLYYV